MAAIDIARNRLQPSLIATAITVLRPTGVSLYVHGAPGIAKSAVARQVADQLGIAFVDFRMSQVASEDVRGVPMLGEICGVKGLIWTPPLIFPRDLDYQQTELVEGSKTIRFFNPLGNNGIHYCTRPTVTVTAEKPYTAKIIDQQADRFAVSVYENDPGHTVCAKVTWTVSGTVQAVFALEEFNSAPPAVMAACYQLILDRRLGDYLVPDGVMLIAMGNRDADRGVTFKLPKPVANRFIHLEMVVNFDDWLVWAIQNKIHSDVVGYLSRWPSKLMDFDPSSPLLSFATPRSWEMVSKVSQQEMASDVRRALVCGAIGDAIGTEYLMHHEFMADMPEAQSILDGTITTFRPKNKSHATQIAYSTAVQMLYRLKELNDAVRQKYSNKQTEDCSTERNQWRQQADRAIGYMMDFFQPEIVVVALRMAMTTYNMRFSSDMPRYAEFVKTNHDLFF